ncbi:MAG: hypothetical protein AAFP80_02220 [Pseudomonadota bacterium]
MKAIVQTNVTMLIEAIRRAVTANADRAAADTANSPTNKADSNVEQ